MKKIIILILGLFSISITYSQSDGLSYQAIIIDNSIEEIPGIDVSGNYLSESDISLKFTIIDQNGLIEYQEIQESTTDKYGMVNLIIGRGGMTDLSPGFFDEISWDGTAKDLLVAIKYNGGEYEDLSQQELLFIPYAYHRNITATGTLIVDDATTLNSTLLVANQSLTHLTGDLIVDGEGLFNGNTNFYSITVENTSDLNGEVNVGGVATFNDQVQVLNESPTFLSGSLTADGITNINNNFNVNLGNSTYLSGPLTSDGQTNINNLFNVNSGHASYFTGAVSIDGVSNLNNNFNVNLGSSSYFSGPVNIDGETSINNEFSVINGNVANFSGDVNIEGVADFDDDAYFKTITVENTSTLNGNLFVQNESPAYLSGLLSVGKKTNLHSTLSVDSSSYFNDEVEINGNFDVIGFNKSRLSGTLHVSDSSTFNNTVSVNSNSNLNGQVTINTYINGGDANKTSYPLRVEGSNQGIAISVNGDRTNDNNFISFWDDDGMQGRIEGQTTSEKLSNPEYLFDQAQFGIQITTNIINLAIAVLNVVWDPGNVAIEGFNTTNTTLQIAAYNVFAFSSIGITYESGSGDYAEWLPRLYPEESINFGHVVGVYGGKITKKTDGAELVMVVSKSPIVLGNMPPDSVGEANCEKVGFMGQVPVWVIGKANAGDYILPSGGNNGYGIAKSPEDMKISDYKKIVGIAWTSTNEVGLSLVNVAIGLHSNSLSSAIEQQEDEIQKLENELISLRNAKHDQDQLLAKLVPGYKEELEKMDDQYSFTREEPRSSTNQKAKENITAMNQLNGEISREIIQFRINDLINYLMESGIEIDESHFLYKIKNDPEHKEEFISMTLELAAKNKKYRNK